MCAFLSVLFLKQRHRSWKQIKCPLRWTYKLEENISVLLSGQEFIRVSEDMKSLIIFDFAMLSIKYYLDYDI